jgi:hypothetical protein
MKQADIHCNSCDKTLGQIQKDDITTDDMAMYSATLACDCGALNSVELVNIQDINPPSV